MIRRCPAPLTAMVAALVFGLGSQPISTQADGISSSTAAGTAEYTLTTTTGLPAPTVPVPGTVFTQLGTITNGSAAVAATSTSELAPGDAVSGTGIPAGDHDQSDQRQRFRVHPQPERDCQRAGKPDVHVSPVAASRCDHRACWRCCHSGYFVQAGPADDPAWLARIQYKWCV